jgi:ABC-2 type transport system permease protein
MTGSELFKLRFLKDIRYQRKVLGTVIDWVIAFYTFIPLGIFGILFYVDMWRNPSTYWMALPGPTVILFVLLFLSMNGKFRTFMHEADQLFLLDQRRLYKRFRLVTYVYASLKMVVSTGIMILIFLPMLTQLAGLGGRELFFLAVYFLAIQLTAATIKRVIPGKIKRPILLIVLLGVAGFLLVYLSWMKLFLSGILLILILAIWHFRNVIPATRYFFHEVNMENQERVRYIKYILGLAREVEKPPIRFGKRPLFFRRSWQLFKKRTPENGLFELLIKGLLRQSVYRRSYLQLIGLTSLAILLSPLWLKWVVFSVFFLFLNYNAWLKGLYERMLDASFFTVVPVDQTVKDVVWIRFKRLLMIPALTFTGFLTVLLTFITIS